MWCQPAWIHLNYLALTPFHQSKWQEAVQVWAVRLEVSLMKLLTWPELAIEFGPHVQPCLEVQVWVVRLWKGTSIRVASGSELFAKSCSNYKIDGKTYCKLLVKWVLRVRIMYELKPCYLVEITFDSLMILMDLELLNAMLKLRTIYSVIVLNR